MMNSKKLGLMKFSGHSSEEIQYGFLPPKLGQTFARPFLKSRLPKSHSHPHHPSLHHPFGSSSTFPPRGIHLFRSSLAHDLIPRPPSLFPLIRSHEPNFMEPILSIPLFAPRDEQEMPENLSKPKNRSASSSEPQERHKDRTRSHSPSITEQEPVEIRFKVSEYLREDKEKINQGESGEGRLKNIECDERDVDLETCDPCPVEGTKETEEKRLSRNKEIEMESESEKNDTDPSKGRYVSPGQYGEWNISSKYRDDEMLESSMDMRSSSIVEKSDEQPENLSGKGADISPVPESTGQRVFTKPISLHSGNSSEGTHFHIPPGNGPHSHEIDPAKDPAIYNSLLPRPGSNDNSWEILIEVKKTSETYKLQQLVNNIEHKLTDPNECVICHRVLSCKSALQLHYRTHTGERPFRCKICGRAFTTKGNLKIHLEVHRLKPPMRVLHQCPVCQQQFTNALVFQQHIRLHTGEPTDLTPQQIHAAEIKDFSGPGLFPHPNILPYGFPPPGIPSLGLQLGMRSDHDGDAEMKAGHQNDGDRFSNSSKSQQLHFSPFSAASMVTQARAAIPSHVSATEMDRWPDDILMTKASAKGVKSPGPLTQESPNEIDCRVSPSPSKAHTPLNISQPPSSRPPRSPSNSESISLGALDLTSRSSLTSSPGSQTGIFSSPKLIPFGGPSQLMVSTLSTSFTSSVPTQAAFSPLGMEVRSPVMGSRTCNICFQTFTSYSALEIHYRNHTKERPFKCSICDRRFSTKENTKQHILTHKIKDIPTHRFESKTSPFFRGPQQTSQAEKISNVSIISNSSSATEDATRPVMPSHVEGPSDSPVKLEWSSTPPVKRSPPESDLPDPKRQPSMLKHLCHVCNRNLSSSSALKTHLRIHTGDKPFRCMVCQKAFTTKGNLKVHMSTHIWNNDAFQLGLLRPLDLSTTPMNPTSSKFLQQRPELFYPHFPTSFVNEVEQKMSEVSGIQSGNHHPSNGLHQTGGKFENILGFGGFTGTDKPLRPDPLSSSVENQLPSPTFVPLSLTMQKHHTLPPSRSSGRDDTPRGTWEHYFDKKINHGNEHIEVPPPPSANIQRMRGQERFGSTTSPGK